MAKATPGVSKSAAGADDIKRLLGDLDGTAITEILSLRPNIAELEEAAMRATGDSDILGKGGKAMSATVGQILEIVSTEAEEDTR